MRTFCRLSLITLAFALPEVSEAAPTSSCPPREQLELPAPGTEPAQLELSYWRERLSEDGLWEQLLMSEAEVRAHNNALRAPLEGEARAPNSLLEPPPQARLEEMVRNRLSYLRDQLDEVYVDSAGHSLDEEACSLFQPRPFQLERATLQVALEAIQVRCGPRRETLYKRPSHGDETIDRNACSQLRAQAPLLVLGEWGPDLLLVMSELALGWIPRDSKLSSPLSTTEQTALLNAEQVLLRAPLRGASGQAAPAGTRLWLAPSEGRSDAALWLAHAGGLERVARPSTAISTRRPMTRGGLLTSLFARIGQRYGLGGEKGGIDCSRLIVDSALEFDLELPRFSGHLAESGSAFIDLTTVTEDRARLALLDAAHKQGQVFLYLPGHIM
ncbi:MAG: hypothetical protein VYD19_07780, partial [Myxococcota bacterium]|nr:hypothetical protein [Myxococcota bacterium]